MCPINQKLECLIYYLFFFLHSKGDKMTSKKSILLFCKTAGNSFAKMCVCCLCINFLKKRRNFFFFYVTILHFSVKLEHTRKVYYKFRKDCWVEIERRTT